MLSIEFTSQISQSSRGHKHYKQSRKKGIYRSDGDCVSGQQTDFKWFSTHYRGSWLVCRDPIYKNEWSDESIYEANNPPFPSLIG